MEAKRLRQEEKELKEQIVLYQRRIEDTPRREQELIFLTRDYDLLKTNYQSLLDKKMQAQMAQNLERKQQVNSLRILDSARIPEKTDQTRSRQVLLVGASFRARLGFRPNLVSRINGSIFSYSPRTSKTIWEFPL